VFKISTLSRRATERYTSIASASFTDLRRANGNLQTPVFYSEQSLFERLPKPGKQKATTKGNILPWLDKKGSPEKNCQKMNFNANWIWRACIPGARLNTLPKSALLMSPVGAPYTGVLNALNISARNSSR
jgi:hypothetical protein